MKYYHNISDEKRNLESATGCSALSNQYPKVVNDEHKYLYWKSVLIQNLLKDDAYELVYVDKFNISGLN